MEKKGQKTIDILASIKHFFELSDWQKRSLWMGVIASILFVTYVISFFLFIIPCIGWVIGGILLILTLIGYLLFAFNISGYTIEISKKIAEDGNVEEISPINVFSKERLKNGLKLFIGQMAYMVPVIILYIVGYLLMIGPAFMLDSNSSSSDFSATDFIALITMIAGYLPLIVAMILQMIIQFFVFPVVMIQYLRRGTIKSMFDFGALKQLIKENISNLLIYLAVSFGSGMAFGLLYLITYISIFLCIGIIIFPVAMAIGLSYVVHLKAHLMGQVYKFSK